MKNIFLFIFALLLINACKPQEIPTPIDTAVAFSFVGKIDSTDFNFEAGKGFYMQTNFAKDSIGIYTLSGSFLVDACLACPALLSFDFNANAMVNNVPVYDANLLTADTATIGAKIFNSYSIDDSVYNNFTTDFQFTPMPFSNTATYIYNLVDTVFTGTTPNVNYTFKTKNTKTISLTITDNGVVEAIYKRIRMGVYTSPGDSIFISNIDTSNLSLYVNAGFTDSAISTYWTFGDSTIEYGDSAYHTFAGQGKYRITFHKVYSTDTLTSEKIVNFNSTGSPFVATNFVVDGYNVNNFPQLQPRQNLSACVITYNRNGKTFKSYKNDNTLNQTQKPIFTLKKSIPYLNNSAGQKTLKLIGSVDTYLYNILNSNDSIKIKCNNVKVAVAVPN
jgi:hypothetical protein